MDDHWNMKRRVVNKKAVGLFPMFAEALAVITGEHDNSIAVKVLSFKESDEAAHLGIGECDFSIIGPLFVLLAEWSRRTVREMRIVEMHPQKKLVVIVLAKPFQRQIGHYVSRTFHLLKIGFQQAIEIEMIVIKVEALIQT